MMLKVLLSLFIHLYKQTKWGSKERNGRTVKKKSTSISFFILQLIPLNDKKSVRERNQTKSFADASHNYILCLRWDPGGPFCCFRPNPTISTVLTIRRSTTNMSCGRRDQPQSMLRDSIKLKLICHFHYFFSLGQANLITCFTDASGSLFVKIKNPQPPTPYPYIRLICDHNFNYQCGLGSLTISPKNTHSPFIFNEIHTFFFFTGL